MENSISNSKSYKLSFQGKGSTLFGIIIVNWLLTVLTLGIYYSWAKAKQLRFIYGSTALNEDHFAFHGTGKEMFKGFLKAMLLFGLIFGIFIGLIFLKMPIIGLIVFYGCIFSVIPLAIHGSYRYRMSRTSWRGIRFGYRGNLKELYFNFLKWIFFSIITLGFYIPWMTINLRNYTLSNIKLGSVEFKYKGSGGDYFLLNLKGYFLSLITLGIYAFWWVKNIFAYYVDNLSLHKGEQQIKLKSTATAGDFFKLFIVNLLIMIFTLGFGFAWVLTRQMDFILSHIQLEGDIDLDTISQTEENFKDATGEDISDFLDLDLI